MTTKTNERTIERKKKALSFIITMAYGLYNV